MFGDQIRWSIFGEQTCWSNVYRTRSNTIKQGVQKRKCLITKQCLIVFDRQTFPVWTELNNVWSNVWRGSNSINRDQTPSSTIKQGVKTGKCLITKQCLIAKHSGCCRTRSAGSQHGRKLISTSTRQHRGAFHYAKPTGQRSVWIPEENEPTFCD